MNGNLNIERYDRQLRLPGFNQEAQQKLFNASVLVIGAGGLGTPVILYLAAAGIGKIGVVDNDSVTLSNLPRQVLYRFNQIGNPKVSIISEQVRLNNPECHIEEILTRWDDSSASSIALDYHIIIDCTDNIESRLVTDRITRKLKVPFIYAAIDGWEGQVSVFNYKEAKSYSEVFPPEPKSKLKTPTAVMGMVPSVAGSIQAAEAIKIVTAQGNVLAGKMLHFSLKTNEFKEFEL